MATIKNFHDLVMWQKSHELALAVYKVTQTFPASEQFGITNQLRRAVVSVPSNIAEGFERSSNREFHQFLIIARGSIAETQAQLLLSRDLQYITTEQYTTLFAISTEVHKIINSFLKTLRTNKLNN